MSSDGAVLSTGANAMAACLERAMAGGEERPAVICGDREYTYGELGVRCRRLVSAFAGLGLEPGDRIAVVSPNCHRVLELYMAVPAGGFVFVPLNHRLTDAELRYALDDSGARLLFTDRAGLGGADRSVRSLSLEYESLIEQAGEAVFGPAEPDTLAALYYTGGTTGGAKGVMLSHRNLASNAATWTSAWHFDPDTRWAVIAPMSHLAGTNAVLVTIAHAGCQLVLPSFSAGQALDLIEIQRATATLVVPTMLAAMAEEQLKRPRDVSSLANLSHGGATASAETLRRANGAFPRARLMEIYGTTETSPNITFLPGEEHLLCSPEINSCGKPVPGVSIAIVDGDDKPVSPGGVGEIVVRGAVVMNGYWNKPEMSGTALAGGWYHTGDLGRTDSNGYLYLVDRKKDVIITGGENVYSTEVEEVLYAHPQVLEVAVFGVPDKKWGEAVHAVVHTRVPVDSAELIAYCQGRIAAFKVPKSVTVATGPLPKSGAGKILKRALREPYWSGRDTRVGGS